MNKNKLIQENRGTFDFSAFKIFFSVLAISLASMMGKASVASLHQPVNLPPQISSLDKTTNECSVPVNVQYCELESSASSCLNQSGIDFLKALKLAIFKSQNSWANCQNSNDANEPQKKS